MRDFSPYFRLTVGFDQLFNRLEQAADAGNGYPPYNIERSDETHYRISVAVAGFGEKDLSVDVRDGVLSVAGKHEDSEKASYLHRGIAGRAFERRFQLAEHVEVRAAKLGAEQIRVPHVGLYEAGAAQIGHGEICTGEIGAVHVRALQVDAGEVGLR